MVGEVKVVLKEWSLCSMLSLVDARLPDPGLVCVFTLIPSDVDSGKG